MRIEIDPESGFCFGVVNAIRKAEEALSDGGRLCCLGDIVHNSQEVERLESLGMETVHHGSLETIAGGRLLIRAHGEPPATFRRAEALGIEVIDATCPVVARLQRLVKESHARMTEAGGQVVIFGKKGHAEVIGLSGQADGDVTVIESEADLERIDSSRPVCLLSQTTQSVDRFSELERKIRQRASDPSAVEARCTICAQVAGRERHLREFASGFDTVVFVCGAKSSNGRVLFDVCRNANPCSHMIEQASGFDSSWLEGCSSVGICGATSTPGWLMQELSDRISEICRIKGL